MRQCLPSVSSCPCLFFCPCSPLQIRGGSGRGVGHPSYTSEGGGPPPADPPGGPPGDPPRGTTPPAKSARRPLGAPAVQPGHRGAQSLSNACPKRGEFSFELQLGSTLAPILEPFWDLAAKVKIELPSFLHASGTASAGRVPAPPAGRNLNQKNCDSGPLFLPSFWDSFRRQSNGSSCR